MKKLDILKGIAELAVSVGVGAIVGNTVKMTTPSDIHTLKRIAISIGSFALSSMVGDRVSSYVSEQIDETAERVNKIVNPESAEEQ